MPVNSRAKGANFEREIGNLLVKDLGLKNPVKRILEQTRTKELPDLMLGRGVLNANVMVTALSQVLIGGIKYLLHQEMTIKYQL